MGNCLKLRRRKVSSMAWAGDDWDSSVAQKKYVPENQSLLDDDHNPGFSSSSSSSSSFSNGREIKIRITKKQLEKLLGEVDVGEMPVDQMLSRLINASDQHFQVQNQQQRWSWRPRLQSIPEVN
ncbi:unnamed protein product [Coffea canephora]|uniref:Uncharacterized protein n=1 Tax=Coffea canephora TaxID=49390 RepID=A0A068U778_COFCA|nr:uncharacterized protein LOC113709023 [Coffea arabica]CDP04395.1 unnamed protein product [Coffea canephora]